MYECLTRTSDLGLVRTFDVRDCHAGLTDHVMLCVEISMNNPQSPSSPKWSKPRRQVPVQINWRTLADQILGPLISSISQGGHDTNSVVLEILPELVNRVKRAHSFSPKKSTTDPLSQNLRANLQSCKLDYNNATSIRERKRLHARMRRVVTALSVNEHMLSMRAFPAARHSNSKSFWDLFKDKDVQNKLPFAVHEITAYFAGVMGTCSDASPVTPSLTKLFSSTVNKATHEPLTIMELITAVKQIRTKSSSGPDKLPTELYKILLENHEFQTTLVSFFNTVIESGYIPQEWLVSKLVTIPKKGKPVALDNLRPISIMAPPMRLFMKIICGRLASFLPHTVYQFGFTTGKSCSEGLLVYSAAVETALSTSRSCVAVFLDLKAAFDTVDHNKLIHLLDLSMIPSPICNVLRNIYRDSTCKVFASDGYGEPFLIRRGVKQGDPASGELFIFYISMLHAFVRSKGSI